MLLILEFKEFNLEDIIAANVICSHFVVLNFGLLVCSEDIYAYVQREYLKYPSLILNERKCYKDCFIKKLKLEL